MKRAAVWLVFVTCFAWGCGDDGDGNSTPRPRITVTPTATSTAQPTPSPTPQAMHHDHILLGSHHAGGGELMAHFDFARGFAELTDQQCIGGQGEACAGGTIIYSGSSPAFETVGEEDAEEHLQPLLPGTRVRLEIVAVDAGVQVQFGGVVLDRAGQSVVLGEAPFHEHGTWQLVLSAGVDPTHGSYAVTFRFVAEGSTYEPSSPYRLRLAVAENHHAGALASGG